MNTNMKELDFPNTIEGWRAYSHDVMTYLTLRVLVAGKHSHHHRLESYNSKHEGNDGYVDTA